MHEVGPGLVRQAVGTDGLHRLPKAGDALHNPAGFTAATGGIEDHQLAHAAHAMVTGDDTDHLAGQARNRARVEDAIGPIRVAAVILHLGGAVGIAVEEDAGVGVRQIRILPTQVENAPVVQHRGAPRVFLIEADLPTRARLPVQAEEMGDGRAAVDAGHCHHGGSGGVEDVAIGQVAGIVVIDEGLGLGADLLRRCATGKAVFVDLPRPLGIGLGEEDAVAVGMQVHIAHEAIVGGAIECCDLAAGTHRREHGQIIAIAILAEHGVALPVGRKPQIVRLAADEQELVEVQQRIFQQSLGGERGDFLGGGNGRGVVLRQPLGQADGDAVEALEVGGAVRVFLGEGPGQIADRSAQGRQIHPCELAGDLLNLPLCCPQLSQQSQQSNRLARFPEARGRLPA